MTGRLLTVKHEMRLRFESGYLRVKSFAIKRRSFSIVDLTDADVITLDALGASDA